MRCRLYSRSGHPHRRHESLHIAQRRSELARVRHDAYGVLAMEVLINELLKAGASRECLQAKVFGGGAVLAAMQQMNIGERNACFVLNHLKTEGIPIQAQDLGDKNARRINYFPGDGHVMVRKMESRHHKAEKFIAKREQKIAETVQAEAINSAPHSDHQ